MSQKTAKDFGMDVLIAVGLNGGLYLLGALVLWPFGKSAFALSLAKGILLFALLVFAAMVLCAVLAKWLKLDFDPPSVGYIALHLGIVLVIQLGWTAFAALGAATAGSGASWFALGILHAIGILASWFATTATGLCFTGSLYKTACSVASLLGYGLFAFQPGLARGIYGWFFAWF